MDFSSSNQYDDSSKENVPPGFDAAAVQRSKQRVVLGMLSENEQHGRSLGEVSPEICCASFQSRPSKEPIFPGFVSHLSPCRRTSFLNTAQPQTDPTSNHGAVPPAPALTSAWKKRVKLSSQHPGNPWTRITQILNSLLWKMRTRGSCWAWFQVSASSRPDLFHMLQLWFALSGSCQDDSMLADESLTSEDVLCVFEYAEDIRQHLTESEVWKDLPCSHFFLHWL